MLNNATLLLVQIGVTVLTTLLLIAAALHGAAVGWAELASAITLVLGLQGSARSMMWIAVSGFTALGLALVWRSAQQLVGSGSGAHAVLDQTLI